MESDQSRPTYATWVLQPITSRQNWPISLYEPDLEHSTDNATTIHLTLMTTSAQFVETSVTTTERSPSQDYKHSDDQIALSYVTPRLKPFTVKV